MGSRKVLLEYKLQGLAFGTVRELSNTIRKGNAIVKCDTWKKKLIIQRLEMSNIQVFFTSTVSIVLHLIVREAVKR